jgi:hypothetical protein
VHHGRGFHFALAKGEKKIGRSRKCEVCGVTGERQPVKVDITVVSLEMITSSVLETSHALTGTFLYYQ